MHLICYLNSMKGSLFLQMSLFFAFLILPKNSIDGVTLSAGSHLDLGVIVMVQKNQTSVESCRTSLGDENEGGRRTAIEKECVWRKCAQQIQYKVDLGYTKVRMGIDGLPYEYPRGLNWDSYVNEKNKVSRVLAERVRRLNNDAFQPFLFEEFEKLIADFYDGHSRILALFKLSMSSLVEERLSVSNYTMHQFGQPKCAKILPRFAQIERDLVALMEQNWRIDWERHNDSNVTDLTFFEAIKYRIPPSPIPMIEAYNQEAGTKKKLVAHSNQLLRLLIELWSDGQHNKDAMDGKCRAMIAEIERIIKQEPLVARVSYSPARSLLVRNLEVILRSKILLSIFKNVCNTFQNITVHAAKGQAGRYFENNMATLRFRFLSMTVVRMEESREYGNFGLLVDLGSSLGLYFGLTLLTLFELLIFVLHFHGSAPASHSTESAEVDASIHQPPVYSIPSPITVAQMCNRRRINNNGRGEISPAVDN